VTLTGVLVAGAGVSGQAAERALAGAVLGQDRTALLAAIARHAPDVPVSDVASTDHGAMIEVDPP